MSRAAWQRLVFLASLALFATSLALTASLALWHWSERSRMVTEAQEQAAWQAYLAAAQIDQQVTHLSEVTRSTADHLIC